MTKSLAKNGNSFLRITRKLYAARSIRDRLPYATFGLRHKLDASLDSISQLINYNPKTILCKDGIFHNFYLRNLLNRWKMQKKHFFQKNY
jgi:hypothetical protein